MIKIRLVSEEESELIHYAHDETMRLDESGETTDMILPVVRAFAAEGHSGASAAFTSNLLDRLLRYKPLSPLTGEDDEWTDLWEGAAAEWNRGNEPRYQSKRLPSVFKNNDGSTYDCSRIVYRYPDKTCTSRGDRVPVTFPYSPPDKPKVVFVNDDGEPLSADAVLNSGRRLDEVFSPDEWHDITTAPKSGTLVWLARPGSMRLGFWKEERWADWIQSEASRFGKFLREDLLFEPTHWRPVPRAPEETSPGDGA